MKKISLAIASMIALLGVAFAFVPAATSYAAPVDEIRDGFEQSGGNEDNVPLTQRIRDIVNILLFLLGAVAVVMIIVGGFRYVLSDGDSSKISGAKNTILYSVAGLVVAILAYAIVNFIITSFD